MIWRVDVLKHPSRQTIDSCALVVSSESHVLRIGTNDLLTMNITIVVQVLVNYAAVLLEDSVRVRVSTIVVDRVEDVVGHVV